MGNYELDKKLFAEETCVLQEAMEKLQDARLQGNELRPAYELLTMKYEKLLKVTRKVFRISDGQGRILQRRQLELKSLLDNTNQGFLAFGPDLIVGTQYSSKCIRIFQRKPGNCPIGELLALAEGIDSQQFITAFSRVFMSHNTEEQAQVLQELPKALHFFGAEIKLECKFISPIVPEEESLIMMVLTDVSERVKAEEQIQYLSFHDKLTSLYNRAYVDTLLVQLDKSDNLPLSVILIDMNGLKLTNDVFGHEQGDKMLVAIARNLLSACRKTDIVARWGGDEFLVLLPGANSRICREVCDRIQVLLRREKPDPVPLSAAIGAATKESTLISISELFTAAENRMYSNKLLQSKEVRRNILTTMDVHLRTRCYETPGHMERLTVMLSQFVAFLCLEKEQVDTKLLETLATLHDIGNVALPRHILGKETKLTADEWEIVRNHSEIGYRMAQSIGEVQAADIILAIHERWDGKGYPYGLKEDQIPFVARVFAIVDVFDVLVYGRPYKEAVTVQEALDEIASMGGTQFDPRLANQFVVFMNQGGNGGFE